MRIRTLVPALACLVAAPIYAADTPAVQVDGFVDSVLSGSSFIDSDGYDGTTNNDSNTAFSYAAKVGLSAAITEKVAAQVDLFINGDTISSTGDDSIEVTQAFGSWVVGDGLTLKTGKFISDYGFIGYYAPELYRVNQGPIVNLYGSNQVGANLAYAKDALTVALTVANGFFDEDYNAEAQSGSGQKDQAMFVGVDVAYDLGKGSVNFELGYDMDANPKGGDGLYAGVNAKFSPNEQLTVAGELVYNSVSLNDAQTGAGVDDNTAIGVMAMANYKLGTALPFDSSVTGMIQYVTEDGDGFVKDSTVDTLEVSAALLTTPAGTKNLNANVEVFYLNEQSETTATESERSQVGAAVELLYVF